ncbi:MAG: nuclear transport factor 2 family protein [Clostridia bacterium]|nr:nuclear transport factor 2 family protein [Clostridia bacterium]
MYRSTIAKDIPALSAVLDESFVLVHMTGMRQGKAAFLKAVKNGTLNYSSAEHDSMEVTLHGDRATLIGKSRVHAVVFGGGWHTWRLEQDLQLIKKNGQWLITLSEAGTY